MKRKTKNAFTLVELLAVIVILAIILVIAVPKVMSVIEDSKKATLESTAKMIASSAEKQKVQNTVLGNTEEITCDSVAKINKGDYASCDIEFENNTAKVTIEGSGKFEGLWVCGGTKTTAIATEESCGQTLVAYIQEMLDNEETLKNGLQNPKGTYEGTEYDTGIRYAGELDKVKNQVYYNCDDVDSNGVSYGAENYDYASSCEVWRIIGVFDVNNGTTTEKRAKIINIASTFQASWDSHNLGFGYGYSQWGATNTYEGADLMRLLNGYYIGKENATCRYCKGAGEGECNYTCDTTDNTLASQNMKPLTNNAKSMLENAVWDTYAVKNNEINTVYLEEKGISAQYTGNSECSGCGGPTRTTSWIGYIGLMSVSDQVYSNGWLDISYSCTITPYANEYDYVGESVWGYSGYVSTASNYRYVLPSVYLKPGIKVIDGNGDDKPYILGL